MIQLTLQPIFITVIKTYILKVGIAVVPVIMTARVAQVYIYF